MQAGMLAECLLAPEPGVNIEQLVVDYESFVEPAVLRAAWEETLESCAVLRTAFQWSGAAPTQWVAPSPGLPWSERDLGSAEAENDFQRWLAADRRRGIPLDAPPLLRLALFRLPTHHRLVWTFHHILLDGRSLPLVLQQVEDVYRALRASPVSGAARSLRPSSEPGASGRSAPRSGEFDVFLDWMQARDASSDRAFWKEYLAGIESATPIFGAWHQRRETAETGPCTIASEVDAETTRDLQRLAERCGVTLGTIVQAAWGLVSCRHHGAADVVFGVTRSGRHFSTGAEDMVGLLINTVPVRVSSGAGLSVEAWLKGLRTDTLRIREHEATSLIDIHAASEIPRGEPLFNTLLILESASLEQRLGALDEIWRTRNVQLIEQSSFPQVLSVHLGETLPLEMTFDPSLVDREVMPRALEQLREVLRSLAREPGQAVEDVAWLPAAEREHIEAFNTQQLIDGEGETLVTRFEAWADRAPEAEAVAAPDRRLTYGELDVRANRLAHLLRRRGVQPGDTVAICLERNSDLIVSILAVLKAGAAYLPLDTFYPKERVQAVANATHFPVLVTLSRLRNSLPQTSAHHLFLDASADELQGCDTSRLSLPLSAADPAYVIFTSGTTGLPKGVRTTHGNVMSTCRAWEEGYRLDQMRSHLQIASPSFDVFSGELIRALGTGGKLVMCPYEYVLKPKQLFELMKTEQVDIAEFVPLVLRSLIDYLETTGERLDFLKLLTAGADAWYVHEYERVRGYLPPDARLINSYGITETTVDSTLFEGDVSHLPQGAVIPIGRPFANAAVYILDERRRPVPIDVVGEIYIGGHGVTPGYLNDPERTAERFLPDPFTDRPGALMYKSGDLGRFRADGTIELVGRADHQVKVRGFRIELGEVETVLATHPDVLQAAVIDQALGNREKRLVGYFVPRAGVTIDVRKLRAYLGDKLPYYMVPAALMAISEVPRTPNGKVDRKALPAPEGDEQLKERKYEAPRDELEARLCELWEELLGIEQVGIRDDFFELGGHSLLAVSLLSRLEARFGTELPLAALFEGRTVARLAEAVRNGDKAWSCVVDLGGEGEEPPLFWVHTLGGAGSGGLFRYERLVPELAMARRHYGIRAPEQPFDRIEPMASFYVEEIRRVQPKGPYHLVGYCFGGIVAYEMAQQLHAMGEEVRFLGLIEAPAQVPRPSPWSSLSRCLAFLVNAWHWWLGFLAWPGPDQRQWLAWQIRLLGRRLLRPGQPAYTLDDFLDNPERAGEYRRYAEAHWEALLHYEPVPHPVRAHVLRTRGSSLGNYESDLGWHRLCEEGVQVEYLTGRHGHVFDVPHRYRLIAALRRALGRDAAQPAAPIVQPAVAEEVS
jgi:amino acid adenylation domain-containing protein